jgi:glycosyltransferase involved in cell wall biosynthesis
MLNYSLLQSYTQIFFFPGKSQYTSETKPNLLEIKRIVHSYNPFNWIRSAKRINKSNPKIVIFRYYNPLLSFCYSAIISHLNKKIKKVALVDNWVHHEPKFYDRFLNSLFSRKIDSYITFSENVALEIESQTHSNIFPGFHPINTNLPKLISKKKAREELNWDKKSPTILFYGLIRPYKGLDNLLMAFSKPPLSLSNAKLAITGEFYESKSKYQKIIKKLKLKNKIYLIPEFSNTRSTQLYFSASDVVALTYKSASQSGVIPLAYFYETPILVTDLSGLRTPIINDKTGLVCLQSPDDISAKLIEILKPNKNKIFIKNIKNSMKYYSWDQYSKHIINFIENNN